MGPNLRLYGHCMCVVLTLGLLRLHGLTREGADPVPYYVVCCAILHCVAPESARRVIPLHCALLLLRRVLLPACAAWTPLHYVCTEASLCCDVLCLGAACVLACTLLNVARRRDFQRRMHPRKQSPPPHGAPAGAAHSAEPSLSASATGDAWDGGSGRDVGAAVAELCARVRAQTGDDDDVVQEAARVALLAYQEAARTFVYKSLYQHTATRRFMIKVPNMDPADLQPGWRETLSEHMEATLGVRVKQAYARRGCTQFIVELAAAPVWDHGLAAMPRRASTSAAAVAAAAAAVAQVWEVADAADDGGADDGRADDLHTVASELSACMLPLLFVPQLQQQQQPQQQQQLEGRTAAPCVTVQLGHRAVVLPSTCEGAPPTPPADAAAAAASAAVAAAAANARAAAATAAAAAAAAGAATARPPQLPAAPLPAVLAVSPAAAAVAAPAGGGGGTTTRLTLSLSAPLPPPASTGGEEYCVHLYYGAGAGPDIVVPLSPADAGAAEVSVDVILPVSPGLLLVQLLHTLSGCLGRGAPLVLAKSAAVAAELCAFAAGSRQAQQAQQAQQASASHAGAGGGEDAYPMPAPGGWAQPPALTAVHAAPAHPPMHPFLLDFGRWAGDAALALGAPPPPRPSGAVAPWQAQQMKEQRQAAQKQQQQQQASGAVAPWQAQQMKEQRQAAQQQSRSAQMSAGIQLLLFSVRIGAAQSCAAIAEGIRRNLRLKATPHALLHDCGVLGSAGTHRMSLLHHVVMSGHVLTLEALSDWAGRHTLDPERAQFPGGPTLRMLAMQLADGGAMADAVDVCAARPGAGRPQKEE
ncbi:hypothetical protein FOA52_012211 [Chlamydomonas sp. UWO 241]|nr:hypothetical protein FOA52_012211 [Chlamydomonas sp. UWO 241]